jgi:hypothetical protein
MGGFSFKATDNSTGVRASEPSEYLDLGPEMVPREFFV